MSEVIVKEKPILFSGPMIRAVIEGRKTMTRRVAAKPVKHPDFGNLYMPSALAREPQYVIDRCCLYGGPGTRLWVREAWAAELDPATSQCQWSEDGNTYKVMYRADGRDAFLDDGDGAPVINKDGTEASPWRPSIHMPRWAARIFLEVMEVRVERLQDISVQDAICEGIRPSRATPFTIDCDTPDPRDDFRALWQSINGKRASWESNPWVWVVAFKVVENNSNHNK